MHIKYLHGGLGMELSQQSASLAGWKPSIPSPSIAQTHVPIIPAFEIWRPEKFKVFLGTQEVQVQPRI